MPSAEVAAMLEFAAIAQNTVPFQVIAVQFAVVGNTRCTQVIPSADVAAIVVPGNGKPAIAQKTVPFHATAVKPVEVGNTPCAPVNPPEAVARIAVLRSSATR